MSGRLGPNLDLSRPVRLSDQLYESILAQIVAGEFPESAKLPTENSLCQRFGVSRPVVREAIARLQADGLVTSVQGAGTFVRRKPTSPVLQFAPIGSLADIQRCFEFREAFEGETAYLAAQRRDDEDIAALKKALDALNEAIQSKQLGQKEDIAFHRAVTMATHNHYFLSVSESIADHTATSIQLSRTLSLQQPTDRLYLVQSEHVAVFDNILKGDAEGARDAMRLHITNARRRIFEGAL
jgi:GntR family transcriptional regulator, transcriptional repressor for pyruvate dehydrogenase complex